MLKLSERIGLSRLSDDNYSRGYGFRSVVVRDQAIDENFMCENLNGSKKPKWFEKGVSSSIMWSTP